MSDDASSFPGDEPGGFRKNFLIVLGAHAAIIGLAWIGASIFVKKEPPEQITWLDGGGETGSSALPLPESTSPEQEVRPPAPEPEILPPLPLPEPVFQPTVDESAMLPKHTPAPSPTPRPTPAPTASKKEPTPKAKKTAPTPTPTPTPKTKAKPTVIKTAEKSAPKKTSPPPATAKSVAKIATPQPGAKTATPKLTDASASLRGDGTGSGKAATGSGSATNAGTKGGPGAAGGSDAALHRYFSKVEAQFHQEWNQPLTVVRSGREVGAYVRLRAAADGTVESLTLVKPTGNLEVDQSIEHALQRVKKLEKPPAELLKGGVLDEMVEFVLEL